MANYLSVFFRNPVSLAILLTGFISCNNADHQEEADVRQPNIIFILSDDAGYADFGCYGGRLIPTPHIDALASTGVRYTNAYVTASVCGPSRAGLMTGRYQQRFGYEHNMSGEPASGYSREDMGVDTAEMTMGDEMRAAGYRTVAIGKWHLGDDDRYFPLNRGFDEFYGFVGGQRSFFPYKDEPKRVNALYDNKRIVPEDSVTYLTDMLTDRAISVIEEDDEKPFFIYLAYNAVHTPMNAKKELLARYDTIQDPGRRAAAAMMASLDENVGRIRDALKRKKAEENTLIVFLNDNGGATTNSSDNGILRGMKGSKWEGGIRVAMLMNWKGKIPAGKTYDPMVSSLDLLPTFLAAAHAKQAGNKKLDGADLLPFITDETKESPHDVLYWRRGVAAAVRKGDWKLIRVKTNPDLLFNLKTDISEKENVADQHPEIVKDLNHELIKWEEGVSSPRWGSAYGDENQILKHRMNIIGRDMERLYP